jgi:chloramphenicol 3-O-phosphotransferase
LQRAFCYDALVKLIFLHGPAACGKLTIGRELEALTGFRLFHNHLVVDALLAVFPFGSPNFVRLREQMWLSVFQAAAADKLSLIFTFAPEATVEPGFIRKAVETVEDEGGTIHFVELACPLEELERRIGNPSRSQFLKLRSVETFRDLRRSGAISFPALPSSGLRIDTSMMQPTEAAKEICTFLKLPIVPRVTKYEPYPNGR